MKGRKTGKFINVCSRAIVEKAVLEAEDLRVYYYGIKENLETILKNEEINPKIHYYGSRVIGLANKDSDLDIYVEYGNNFYTDKDVDRDRPILEKIASIVEHAQSWTLVCKILNASVPILQVVYRPSNIKCDISVSNGLGVANSKMMAYMFDLQPQSRKFYQFMKIFLKRYKNIHFDGYLLKLLVIFLLQNENVFPSSKMIQEKKHVRYINDWPTVEFNLDENAQISQYGLIKMMNYRSYIPKFFKFYSKFKYSKFVMSTYDGKLLERINYGYNEEIENNILCIFGPLNRKHNIGKYPSKNDIEYFITLCKNLKRVFTINCDKYDFTS